ncbi:TrkA family potassium uptake protein [Candidatus Saccharibacteria bacterium]|nr:TrkA family potassium uptake protein [Candidatus Saccharibacteria bacterium]
MNLRNRWVRLSLVFISLLLAGSLALTQANPELGFWNNFYYSLTILLTHFDHHGYHGLASRVYVIIMMLANLIFIAYLLKYFAEYIMQLDTKIRDIKLKKKLDKITNHYIVCGTGRVGSNVAKELRSEGVSFVTIDKREFYQDQVESDLHIVGDASLEQTLLQAGLKRAKGIIVSLGQDAENLLVTVTARQLNPEIFIVARSHTEAHGQKLLRAGADRITMPHAIGGYHMATMLLRPDVVDFLDILGSNKDNKLQIEEILIEDDSKVLGKTISQIENLKIEIQILAVIDQDGEINIKPAPNTKIHSGQKLILLGKKLQLRKASEIL